VKDLALSISGLGRKKLRTGLLIFAVFIAFLIYAVLAAFSSALTAAAGSSSGDRLTVSNKINFTQSLPLAYVNRVSTIEGVKDLSYSMWFGGYYQEQRNFLIAFAVEPESYTRIYKEYVAPPEQMKAFIDNRDSVMVGFRLEARPADPAFLQHLDARRRQQCLSVRHPGDLRWRNTADLHRTHLHPIRDIR